MEERAEQEEGRELEVIFDGLLFWSSAIELNSVMRMK